MLRVIFCLRVHRVFEHERSPGATYRALKFFTATFRVLMHSGEVSSLLSVFDFKQRRLHILSSTLRITRAL